LATDAMPTAPPAPVRLMTTTGCFSAWFMPAASGLPTMSATPPGGNGTTIVSGFDGYASCADAPAAQNAMRRETRILGIASSQGREINMLLQKLHFMGSLQGTIRVKWLGPPKRRLPCCSENLFSPPRLLSSPRRCSQIRIGETGTNGAKGVSSITTTPVTTIPAILPAGPADRRRGEAFARVPGVPGLPGVPRVPCERRREHRAGDRRRGGHRRSHRARTRAVAAHSSCSIVFVRTGRFARPTCRAVKSKGDEDGSAYIAEDPGGERLCLPGGVRCAPCQHERHRR